MDPIYQLGKHDKQYEDMDPIYQLGKHDKQYQDMDPIYQLGKLDKQYEDMDPIQYRPNSLYLSLCLNFRFIEGLSIYITVNDV